MKRPPTEDLIEAVEHCLRRIKEVPAKCGRYGICWRFPLTNAGNYMRNYVKEQLGEHNAWLEQWLLRERRNYPRNNASMKRYRIEWLNWMLTQLKGNP